MQNQVLAAFGVVVWGSLALSCASADANSSASGGTGGTPVNTGNAGGPSSGGGGAAPAATGGAGASTTAGTASTSGVGGALGGTGGAPSGGTGGADTHGGTGGVGGSGMGGAAGATGDTWGGLKNPPRKSAGCDKPATITNGAKTIMSGGMMRSYLIDIPANYDPATPYRLFFVGHGMPAPNGAQDVAQGGWWGLKPQATAANVPAIWVAPQGIGGSWSSQDNREHVLFDDITGAVKDGLCVDTTRIFAAGMSGGGMLSYSLSTARQKVIRAGFGMSPTNFNTYVPAAKATDPIAWMQTTGMGDTLTAWIGNEAQKRGSKFIALEKATDNGCTIPATIPVWTSGNHVCYDFAGCKPGYPVKACTFNGGHVHFNSDPGGQNWIAKEGWEFLMQF